MEPCPAPSQQRRERRRSNGASDRSSHSQEFRMGPDGRSMS
jgi:hypothetical protein